jgi:hypothetical protein
MKSKEFQIEKDNTMFGSGLLVEWGVQTTG